jgi:nickel-dependent lactate racemase
VPLPDPSAAVRQALETPSGFPALRRALTPDDHVVIVVDERLPHLPEVLIPIFEHIQQAHVRPEALTLLCPLALSEGAWPDQLPEGLRSIPVEVHDPAHRQRLSYLATTKQGRRIYLNRTAVDADQLVVLAGCGYDPLLGYAGGEGALFPALSDEATRRELCARLSTAAPGKETWPVRREAGEVAWLLGAPFMVQIVEGARDEVVHVVGGLADTSAEVHALQDARWRIVVEEPADTVIAAVSGSPERHDFGDLARAVACAARVVKRKGRILLLTQARPALGSGADLLRRADEPDQALSRLRKEAPPDMAAVFLWASTAQQASVYLLSGISHEIAEELFTVPLDNASQVQRLLEREGSYLFLPDAHKTLAVLAEGGA